VKTYTTIQAMYIKRNIRAHSCNYCCHGKEIKITYCGCVSVALVIQHTKRMRRVVLSFVACLSLLYISHIFS
jgi:hypothetical protein